MHNQNNGHKPCRMRGAGYQIDFRPGQTCLLQFQANGHKYKASVIGVEQYAFIMARLPVAPGILNHMRAGNSVLVRTEQGGTVYAFTAEILAGYPKPAPILVFAHPPAVEGLRYREHKRTKCMLPAHVTNEFFKAPGLVTDMSVGGCRVVVDWKEKDKVFNMMTGDRLTLTMHLDGDSPQQVPSTLMNFKELRRHYTMGLKFHEEQKPKSLAYFIGRLEGAWAAITEQAPPG
ncbi:MAG: flagellar brake protein [Thermodesulfobacteriota bacterium]